MLTLAKRLQRARPTLPLLLNQLRSLRTDSGSSSPNRRRSRFSLSRMKKPEEKSEWWVVDGEMHEIGDNVPPRERFVIPRDNIPNTRRKQLREQFMRRTRLIIKDSEHEPWCKRYMELYQELRENWERLYWDEGFSKKLGQEHANYDSAEDDDQDFSPYRRRQPQNDPLKDQSFGRNRQGPQGDNWEVSQLRDKFEYDRERRMRDKAFAPMKGEYNFTAPDAASRNQPFDANRYLSASDSDQEIVKCLI